MRNLLSKLLLMVLALVALACLPLPAFAAVEIGGQQVNTLELVGWGLYLASEALGENKAIAENSVFGAIRAALSYFFGGRVRAGGRADVGPQGTTD